GDAPQTVLVAILAQRDGVGKNARLQRVDQSERGPVQGERHENNREQAGAAPEELYAQRCPCQQQLGGRTPGDVSAEELTSAHRWGVAEAAVVAPEPKEEGGDGGGDHAPRQRDGIDDERQ